MLNLTNKVHLFTGKERKGKEIMSLLNDGNLSNLSARLLKGNRRIEFILLLHSSPVGDSNAPKLV